MKQIACILILLLATPFAWAMASTDVIEGPIKPDTAWIYAFPDNTLTLINDWHRVYAWHPWFSELPNATYCFAFAASNMSEVNELLGYLGEIKAEQLELQLSPLDGDSTIGRQITKDKTKPEVGPLTFSISSQKQLDDWFDRLDEKGRVKFHVTERPSACAPTMTLFAGNKLVDLEKLKIPTNVTLKAAISEWQRKDAKLTKVIERIEKFVSEYQAKQPATAPRAGT